MVELENVYANKLIIWTNNYKNNNNNINKRIIIFHFLRPGGSIGKSYYTRTMRQVILHTYYEAPFTPYHIVKVPGRVCSAVEPITPNLIMKCLPTHAHAWCLPTHAHVSPPKLRRWCLHTHTHNVMSPHSRSQCDISNLPLTMWCLHTHTHNVMSPHSHSQCYVCSLTLTM